jgi:TRAP-type C4-dicarboxylate transport system substrate-binding protein
MKKTFLLLMLTMAFFLVSVVTFDPAVAQKKPVVLRLVVPAPEGDWPLTYKDKEMAKRFNARAKGEYVIEVFAGGALAKVPEYFDAVRIGAVEMADVAWPIFTGADPRLGLLESPFLFNSKEASVAAAKSLLPLHDMILQEKFNAKALGLMNIDGLELESTKPVKTLEDWKGLLIGAVSPPMAALVKGLGGSPVTIMWTDAYESLQKKVIDAVAQSTHGAINTGNIDVCKHVTLFFGIAAWNGYSINLDVWKKMPKDIQKILQEEVDWTVDWMHKTYDTLGDEDTKTFKQKGVSIYIIPKEERGRWEKLLVPYKEKQIASFGEFGQKVRQIADDVNNRYSYKERIIK